jgi:tRNA-splicing ligase RtcB
MKKESENTYVFEKEGDMKVPLKVFASEKLMVDIQKDRALEQGINMAKLPGICKHAIMMPDAHQGYGFPIGGVAAFDAEKGIISPGGIGYDINCGVRILTSNLGVDEVREKLEEILNVLYENIHTGIGSESKIRLETSELEELLDTGIDWAIKKGYATEEDKERCEENGRMPQADSSKVSDRAKKRGRKQVGSLGAGNHFIEIQAVEKILDKSTAEKFGIKEEGQVVIMIHSGSRGLGHQVCTDYLRRMETEQPEIFKSLEDKELIYAPLGTEIADDYYKAMSAAANFGWCNRQVMTYETRNSFKKVFPNSDLKLMYDVCHNMAKLEEHEIDGKMKKVYVHRKGATRAFGPGHREIPEIYRDVGQPILIPGSMGTASYVLVGTDEGMKETFGSTPHGAGRLMSRHQANKLYTGEQVQKDLKSKGILVRSASWRGVSEEAPGAYKDIDEVVKVSHEVGIGKIVAKLVPLGVLKG